MTSSSQAIRPASRILRLRNDLKRSWSVGTFRSPPSQAKIRFRPEGGTTQSRDGSWVWLSGALVWLALLLVNGATALAQGDDRLIGVWEDNDGFMTAKLLFRSSGRYQLDEKSSDPAIDLSSSERGQYQVDRNTLILTPYDYLIKPAPRRYKLELSGDSFSLTSPDYGQIQTFRFRPGSDADVLAREQVDPQLVRVWRRHVAFYGEVECTFRPGGYYAVKQTPDNPLFDTSYVRGRYERTGNQLTFKPYSAAPEIDELDFFGEELTLIETDSFSRTAVTFQAVPGSEREVPVKAAEAEAFLASANWQVGIWEVRQGNLHVDLTLRPDGHYVAELQTVSGPEIVRGLYTLESKRIQLSPFVGQDLYAHSGGEFGNAEAMRQLDYYDGELQFIDLSAVIQWVTVARKRPGSDASVLEKLSQARAAQTQVGWAVGIWQVNDGAGWMEFTFRPDGRYIVQAGKNGIANEVERGKYQLRGDKLTLACYPNLGQPGAFITDYYDDALLLIGDRHRMLVARKVPGSETGVTEATTRPKALEGAWEPLVGLWSQAFNGSSAELLLRPDGQFRYASCIKAELTKEYGLYAVDLASRTLVVDSRVAEPIIAELDVYADTVTLVSTNQGFPLTFVIHPELTEAALQVSFAADVQESEMNRQWLDRIPIGPTNPDIGQAPSLPIDLRSEHVLDGATVFTEYRHYQRFIRGFVYEVEVDNSQEWHFLRNGRVMMRFIQHRAAPGLPPVIVADVIDAWGAYTIQPKPPGQDVLHRYADNVLRIETDLGETLEMTLEDGRRHLFWGRDRAVVDEWAAEDQPALCLPPADIDPRLMNTGLSLQTSIAPDDFTEPVRLTLLRSQTGDLTMEGSAKTSANLVTQHAVNLVAPVVWQPLQTNAVLVGPFRFVVPAAGNGQGYYRLRQQ